MNIIVIGSADRAAECRAKFGDSHQWTVCQDVRDAKDKFEAADFIFDFVSPGAPEKLKEYPAGMKARIFVDTSCAQLSRLAAQASFGFDQIFGFCGLPSLLNREVLEVSVLDARATGTLEAACLKLATPYELVADHAGMVSPRVIAMIINEAYLTLEEGTATRADIDLAMKLGTNYPFGPFEWAERIGVASVVKVLQASLKETGDERYTACRTLLDQARGV